MHVNMSILADAKIGTWSELSASFYCAPALGSIFITSALLADDHSLVVRNIFSSRSDPDISMKPAQGCVRTSNVLRTIFHPSRSRDFTLPIFLVPSVTARRSSAAQFSTTVPCRSKIGAAPLNLPPEVSFRFLPPPPPKNGQRLSRTEPSSTVEVEGPLGKMSMEIPPFIKIAENDLNRTRTLSVLDPNDKKQRAMWGE